MSEKIEIVVDKQPLGIQWEERYFPPISGPFIPTHFSTGDD